MASGDRALALTTSQRARRRRASDVAPTASMAAGVPEVLPAGAAPTASFFETTSDAILRFDAQCRVVYANGALERAFALARTEFLGRRLSEVEAFAAYAPLWEANLADALDTLDSRWFKFAYAHPTGRKQFDVRMTVEVARAAPGAPSVASNVTALLRDVTVPREALRVSRAADDFVQTLLASAPMGVGILDRDLRYQSWNEKLEELLGIPASDALGRRPDEIPALAGRPQTMVELQAMRDGRVRDAQTVEYALARADGSTGPWLRVQRTPVFDRQGRFQGVFTTTERLDRERFAELSLAALRRALDSAGEMVLEIDRAGSVLDANETALAWLGYPRDQLKGMPLAQIDTRLSAQHFAEILDELAGRGAWNGETRYRSRLGSEFPVDVVLQRVEESGREFIFLLVRDITERKRIEQRLADSAWRFRTIFEESPVAKLLLGADFLIAQANIAASQLLGQAADDLVGHAPDWILQPEHAGAIDALRSRLAAGEASASDTDRRLRHCAGHLIWARLTLRAWSTGEQAPGGLNYLLVLEDITERKLSEEQLQILLTDQQTLLETMTVGVAQASNGRILLANREFGRMFGYGDDEVVGMSLWDLARDHENRMPQEVSGLPAVREGQTTSAEVVLFRHDGEPVWCLVQARPVTARADDPGAARRAGEAIYTFQDISEMKRQREALGRSLLELNVVLDTTAVGVLHLADERIVRCNAQAAQQFAAGEGGMPEPGELVGRHVSTLFAHGAEYEAHREALLGLGRPAPSEARPYEVRPFEAQLRAADGTPFWALVTVRGIVAGEPAAGQIVSVLDIDERKRQEEQLQTLLAESRLMFDTALVGLLFVRDGRPVRANAAMEELLACEPGALINQGQLFAHPTDQLLAASLAEHYDEIAERGACEFELHMFRRRGDPIWVAVQGRAVNPERPELGYIFAFVNVDERRRSERELRTALSELQLIFDNALVGMAFVADELVVKANAAAERMFGYSARDLRELEIGSLFADRAEWDEMRVQAAAGESGHERLMRRADGSAYWCAVNARPLDPLMPERGMILAMMDVDVRRRSEDELKRVRNYLDLVVENLPVLVSVREVESGRFVSLNRAGEQITGLTREQVLGRTWHEIYGRQFADLYAEMDRRALAAGQQVERPREIMLRADGRTLTVNQRVLPLYEPGDEGRAGAPRARYVMSIIDDLTEEVRAEAALRETETRFRQFAENIDQLVFIATADLTSLLYVNPRYPAVVGSPVDEVLDDPRNALKHVHFDDAPAFARKLPRIVACMRRLRKAETTVRIDHPSRGVRQLALRFNPVRMFDGSVRVFGVADDITERTAAERQRIEEAIKQRDILVREVHHRIKNNLQGVAGLLQHMATSKPEVAPQLNEIAGQIQAIAQVHGLQIRATGTLPVLGVAQGIFQNLATMFGADIRFEPPAPGLWKWGLPEGEAVPLALVVNELCTNAIKYRASRDNALTVRMLSRPEGVELRIEQPGLLKAGFDLAQIASSVSGLGLVKALLPRRGARLSVEQQGAQVLTRLELSPPAIGEETLQ